MELAISQLLNLTIQEANRVAHIKEPIEALEKEVLLMNALIKSAEAMVEGEPDAAKWMEEASIVTREAENLIAQYEKSLAKRKGAAILKWPYLKERYDLALQVERVTLEIQIFSEIGNKILNMPSSSQEVGDSDSSLHNLSTFLSQNVVLDKDLSGRLSKILDEMAPFDRFQTELEAESEVKAELDKRQNVWVQEIKDTFQILVESFESFQILRETETKYLKCFGPVLMPGFLVSKIKLKKKIVEIEKRIGALTSRYHLYAIGELKVRGGLRLIYPQILRSNKNVEQAKSSSIMATARENVILGRAANFMNLLFSKKPSVFIMEQFNVDLKLMDALFEDASRMGESEKRVKVWLKHMGAIYVRLKTLDTYAKEISEGGMGIRKILSLRKIVQEAKEIEEEIHDALTRKIRYDIGSFVAENGNREVQSIAEGGPSQPTLPGKLKEQDRLMKELQLMGAFLEDIGTMEKLDARLKIWLQEILGVSREANAIVEQDFREIFRRTKVARKINKINKWIDDISEWKRTYGIGIQEIRATNGSRIINHNLEAAEAYPLGILAAEFESLRREVKLMKALEDDIKEVVGVDGKLKVWMEEMCDVARDTEKFIDKYDEIMRERGIPNLLRRLKLEWELVSQEKHQNGILHIKDNIQKLHKKRIRYGIGQINRITANVNGETSRAENETWSVWEQLNEGEILRPESSTDSYDSVPFYLWRCLFYFLLFPTGMEVPARRLIALWVAEGLVGPKRGENRPAEYFCALYLSELVHRRIIKATKRKLNGKVKACQLCDDIQKTLFKKAKEANFFQDASGRTFRLVHDANIDVSKYCPSSEVKKHKKVISFFSFDTEEGGNHGDDIEKFLHKCISKRCFLSLRVLDLEYVFKPKLPSALGILTGLRYLGLRWTYLERLPDVVSKLLNLQVLDIKRTYISTLPKSIWSMQYLRHLYLSETYRSRFAPRPRNKSLTDLLTLWGAFIDEDSPVLDGLDTILNVRKLGLTCRSMSSVDKMKSQLEAVGDWIQKLEHLEELRLKSFDDLGDPSDLYLKPLSGLNNLSAVYLVGKLKYPSILSAFPANLTDLTLSRSELDEDPMVSLVNLKRLIILRLFCRSTTVRTMKCTKGGFPQLQVLKIWSLPNLEAWELEQGALPSLKDLEIRNCQNLKMIPDEFAKLIKDQAPSQTSALALPGHENEGRVLNNNAEKPTATETQKDLRYFIEKKRGKRPMEEEPTTASTQNAIKPPGPIVIKENDGSSKAKR